MTYETIEAEITRFLKSNSPEVMAIIGSWGIGKTYAWKHMALKNKNSIALKKYSYISLFGINSLEDFKFKIFENAVATKNLELEPSLKTFQENTEAISKILGKKLFNLIVNLPHFKSYSNSIIPLSFLSVTEMIICIDDIERRGKDLDIKDLLGTILSLKETKKCKIVLIFNDSVLDDESKTNYKDLREKVIDIEIRYNPTAEESVNLALEDNETNKSIKKNSKELHIKNIRIIKKIEYLSNKLLLFLKQKEYEDDVIKQSLQTLALACVCFYDNDDEKPSFIFLKGLGLKAYGNSTGLLDDKQKKWIEYLKNYDFIFANGLDKEIMNFVERGYICEEEMFKQADECNSNVILLKKKESIKKTWGILHDSFDDNSQEFISQAIQGYKDHIDVLSLNELNGIVVILRELNSDASADEIIDTYISTKKSNRNALDIDDAYFTLELDSILLKKVKSAHQALQIKRELNSILQDIAQDIRISENDSEVLKSSSVNDFYLFFKSKKGSDLTSLVRKCLRINYDFVMKEPDSINVINNIKAALIQIAKESPINRIRMRKFGIDPPA